MIYGGLGIQKAELNLVFTWLLSFFLLALKTFLSESFFVNFVQKLWF